MLKHQCECGQVALFIEKDSVLSPSGKLSLSEGASNTFCIEVTEQDLVIDAPVDAISSFVINRTLRQFVCSHCADALFLQTPQNTYLITATLCSHDTLMACGPHHCSV